MRSHRRRADVLHQRAFEVWGRVWAQSREKPGHTEWWRCQKVEAPGGRAEGNGLAML